jgi:hypothetical protein
MFIRESRCNTRKNPFRHTEFGATFPSTCDELAASFDNQNNEGIRFDFPILAGPGNIRGDGKELMCSRIERHRSCSFLRGDGFGHAEIVGVVLVNDGNRAVSSGCESILAIGVESRGVASFANRRIGDDAATVRIDDSHLFVATPGEQAPILAVNGESSGLFAVSNFPALLDGELLWIEGDEFGGVFNVYEDRAFLVGGGEFGFAAEIEFASNLAFRSIDRGCVMAARIEGENALRERVIKYGVGAGADFDLLFYREGLEVEDAHRVFPAVAGVAAAIVVIERDPVDTRRVRDFADLLSRGCLNDGYSRGASNEETLALAVNHEVVPSSIATQFPCLRNFVIGTGNEYSCGQQSKKDLQESSHVLSPVLFEIQ